MVAGARANVARNGGISSRAIVGSVIVNMKFSEARKRYALAWQWHVVSIMLSVIGQQCAIGNESNDVVIINYHLLLTLMAR
jgi:hypothetical protein